MSLTDVQELRDLELHGEPVASWQARPLWDRCKYSVETDEQALLLSRLLRANQHHYLLLLARALDQGVPDVLLQFLSPQYSEHRTDFVGLDPVTLQFERLIKTRRQPTYARSQGARAVRVAYEALADYAARGARNVHFVDEHLVMNSNEIVRAALERAANSDGTWREELSEILALDPARQDVRLAHLFRHSYVPPEDFSYVRSAFDAHLDALAVILARRLDEGRVDRLGDDVASLFRDL